MNELAACYEVDEPRGGGAVPFRGPVFVALVGPPGRGKSAAMDVLVPFFKNHFGLETDAEVEAQIQVWNAGEIRRVWESTVKRKDESGELINIDHLEGLRSFSEETRADLVEWAMDPSAKAIPASLYQNVSALNEAFAQICIREGFARLARGDVSVILFDATNTNCARREDIMDAMHLANDEGTVSLMFFENMCPNQERLFRNFASKLCGSGDYKHHYDKDTCPEFREVLVEDCLQALRDIDDHRPLLEVFLMRRRDVEDRVLHTVPQNASALGIDEGRADEMTRHFLADMLDITERDILSYQTKYRPLHAPCVANASPRADSTITLVNAYNEANEAKAVGNAGENGVNGSITYMQVINEACTANGDQTRTIDNIAEGDSLQLQDAVRRYNVSSKGANYDSKLKRKFTGDEDAILQSVMDMCGQARGGGHVYTNRAVRGGAASTLLGMLPVAATSVLVTLVAALVS